MSLHCAVLLLASDVRICIFIFPPFHVKIQQFITYNNERNGQGQDIVILLICPFEVNYIFLFLR